jgi:hypothetical protein
MLPLSDLPPGWVIGKSGTTHLETFNAQNLYEKIDGRAESFLQYNVQGMAYAYYHPLGDDSSEAQLYIFEMGDPLKALGKYGSEKPSDVTSIPMGSEGYTSAGSTFFYLGKYYTQIVTTKDDAKIAAFSLELAKRVAASQQSTGAGSPTPGPVADGRAAPGPETIFKLLPAEPKRSGAKYVAQDVFGYSFLSDVFMADYEDGDVKWQGFVRAYESPEAAKAVFEKYLESAKQDGATIKQVEGSSAERMIVSSNIGLVDAIFLKGNAVGGANGSTDGRKAEGFAKSFAKDLPGKVPVIAGEKQSNGPEPGDTEGKGG